MEKLDDVVVSAVFSEPSQLAVRQIIRKMLSRTERKQFIFVVSKTGAPNEQSAMVAAGTHINYCVFHSEEPAEHPRLSLTEKSDMYRDFAKQ